MRMGWVLRTTLLVAVFLVVTTSASSDEDGFKDKLKKCFTVDWLKGFIPCFAGKFKDIVQYLLDNLFPDGNRPFHEGGGRQLLSAHMNWASFLPPRQPFRSSAESAEGASGAHFELYEEYREAVLGALKDFLPRNTDQRARQLLFTHFAQLDMTEVLTAYSDEAVQWLAEMQALGLQATSQVPHQQGMATPYGVQSVIDRLVIILAAVCEALPDEDMKANCNNIVDIMKCVSSRSIAELEDTITWTQCIYQCRDLPAISSCVAEQFSTNLQCELPWPIKDLSWVSHVAMNVMTGILKLDNCTINIITPDLSAREDPGLTLVEGAAPQMLAFTMYMHPSVYCVNLKLIQSPLGLVKGIAELLTRKIGKCDVTVNLASQSFLDVIASKIPKIPAVLPKGGDVPVCLSGTLRRLAVFGMHPMANDTLGPGDIPITSENWNKTFYVPLVATTDSIPDGGFADAALGFRLKVGRRFQNITRVPLTIQDPETKVGILLVGTRTCFVYGRGHVITHRDAYYNNFYEGHFYLYKHNTLPYEVQAVYQSCSTSAGTCACAVAVLFGNDVFVVDKCRREDTNCGETGCQRLVRSILYQNEDISPNVRIYRKYGGLKFQVLLPHGTLVTIDVHDEHVSAFIRPSASDLDASKGLCGEYVQSGSNVILPMPDGTGFTLQDGILPRNFTQAWRVPDEDQLVQGALANRTGADDTRYCTCTHVLYKGSTCTCGDAFRTETCDMDTDDDMTGDLSQIAIPSVKQYISETAEDIGDILDIDLSYEPEDTSWDDIILGESQARNNCSAILSADPVITMCKDTVGSFSYETHIKACVDNIKASNSTDYVYTTIEAVRQKCRDWTYRAGQGKLTLSTLNDIECPNDCHGLGVCTNGTCVCSGGYVGPSCAISASSKPQVMMVNTVLCDSRHEDCAWAKIFGYNLHDEARIQISAVRLEVDDSGSREFGQSHVSDAVVLTPTQAAARLPSEASYRIHVSTSSSTRHVEKRSISSRNDPHSFTYLVFDAMCYGCDVQKQSCARRPTRNHCLIGGACMAAMALDPADSCYVCDPHQDRDDWAVVDTEVCQAHHQALVAQREQEMRVQTVRIVCAVVLCLSIVIATVILYIFIGRKGKALDTHHPSGHAQLNESGHPSRPSRLISMPGAHAYNPRTEKSGSFVNPAYHSSVSVVSDADYSEAL